MSQIIVEQQFHDDKHFPNAISMLNLENFCLRRPAKFAWGAKFSRWRKFSLIQSLTNSQHLNPLVTLFLYIFDFFWYLATNFYHQHLGVFLNFLNREWGVSSQFAEKMVTLETAYKKKTIAFSKNKCFFN